MRVKYEINVEGNEIVEKERWFESEEAFRDWKSRMNRLKKRVRVAGMFAHFKIKSLKKEGEEWVRMCECRCSKPAVYKAKFRTTPSGWGRTTYVCAEHKSYEKIHAQEDVKFSKINRGDVN